MAQFQKSPGGYVLPRRRMARVDLSGGTTGSASLFPAGAPWGLILGSHGYCLGSDPIAHLVLGLDPRLMESFSFWDPLTLGRNRLDDQNFMRFPKRLPL